jgi:hypothetical protein
MRFMGFEPREIVRFPIGFPPFSLRRFKRRRSIASVLFL